MARLRYVKGPAPTARPANTRHIVRSLRARYETEPAIAAALLPRPLAPAERPEIFVQFADVTMHLPAGDRSIGAATVGVACRYEDEAGYYVLAMPMEGEFVVIGGREIFGEPKKLATTSFSVEAGRARASVTRHDVAFLEVSGAVGAPTDGPREFTERFYCFKAMPSIARDGGFDGDVFLTRLIWDRHYTSVRRIDDPRIVLRDSPFDPLADVPVKRVVSMELAEGATRTRGEVVRAVPGEWLEPFLVQRYDEPHEGIDVAVEDTHA